MNNEKISDNLFVREINYGDKVHVLAINRGYDKEMGYLGEFPLYNENEIKALYRKLKEYCKEKGIIKFKSNNKKKEE